MNEEEIFYNALNIVFHTQYKELKRMKNEYGSWQKSWEQFENNNQIKIDPQEEYKKIKNSGIRLILEKTPEYPKILGETALPPLGIYVCGKMPQFEYSIAIVGTRKATSEGKELAFEFGRELSRAGCVIVSGLALGIDTMGHRGAIESNGITVAVLANGLDNIYPSTNANLAKEIIRQNGALISEYPLGSPSLPYRFLERNRIVSGLSRGVLIIEAPARSGTLATARFAVEDNRDVFVVPGPARHPNFAVSHELIKQGAALVTKPEDILEDLGLAKKITEETANLSPEEAIIFDIIKGSATPLFVDKIIEISHLQASMVNQLLSFLVAKDLVEETEVGYTTI